MTRVTVYPADRGGCGHYRLIWPAEALAAEGMDVRIVMADDETGDLRAVLADRVDTHGRKRTDVVSLAELPDTDVVVFQRPLTRIRVDLMERLQAAGIPVVVEIDDDFSSIHPRNVSWRNVHPLTSSERNWNHLARACRIADLVTVTTPALAERYGRHGRVKVLPNCVPARYLDEWRGFHPGIYVGWTGSVETHPTDLQVVGSGVADAMRGTDARFAVVGTGRGVQQALHLPDPPIAPGWLPIEQYPQAMAQFDIGIVPLDRIRFNEAKSWLKGLEFAALGVPFVASPLPEYRRLAAEGAGILASKPKDWRRELRALIQSQAMRDDLADKGREVAARWTIEANAWRWWDAWRSVLTTRKDVAA